MAYSTDNEAEFLQAVQDLPLAAMRLVLATWNADGTILEMRGEIRYANVWGDMEYSIAGILDGIQTLPLTMSLEDLYIQAGLIEAQHPDAEWRVTRDFWHEPPHDVSID